LFHLKFARHIKAGSGGDGSGDRSTGADGEDKFIEVPLGTVVETKRLEKFCSNYRRWRKQVLSRGKGGLGNWHFRSATNQTQDMLNLVYQDQRWMQFWS
jgi:GTP-binding protein